MHDKNEVDTRSQLKDYATEYEIGQYKLVWRGKSWAICESRSPSFCYNKFTKGFVYEPMPSNRDKKFFEACRFGLVEAKELIEKLNKEVN